MTRRALGVRVALALALAPACSRRPITARAVVRENRHDFGRRWVGEIVRHTFRVENVGSQPLELDEVRSTCGCLLHQLSTKKVEPGQSAEVIAELHADKGPGHIDKMLSIGTNDPEHRRIEFALAADLELLYRIDPPLLDAQALVLGDPLDLIVKLAGADGSELKFGTPASEDEAFSATVRAATRDSAEIVVHFAGDARTGRRLFGIRVPTGHPIVPEALIPVQAVVLSRIVVEPTDRVDFGNVARAKGGRVELTVRRRGVTPLATAPTVAVELRPPPDKSAPVPKLRARLDPVRDGEEWKLLVEVEPESPAATLVGRVTVRLDAPNEPPHTLTLTGRISE